MHSPFSENVSPMSTLAGLHPSLWLLTLVTPFAATEKSLLPSSLPLSFQQLQVAIRLSLSLGAVPARLPSWDMPQGSDRGGSSLPVPLQFSTSLLSCTQRFRWQHHQYQAEGILTVLILLALLFLA